MEVYDRKIRSLPELIAALEECDGGDKCAACAYNDVGDGCGNVMEMDALFWLKELRSDNERLSKRWTEARNDLIDEQMRSRDYEKKVLIARAERDTARRKVSELEARLLREAECLPGPRTNYRKIKNMGPLHFADWIMRTVAPCECCDKQGVCGIPEDEVNDEYCAEHILLWLMQEAENE